MRLVLQHFQVLAALWASFLVGPSNSFTGVARCTQHYGWCIHHLTWMGKNVLGLNLNKKKHAPSTLTLLLLLCYPGFLLNRGSPPRIFFSVYWCHFWVAFLCFFAVKVSIMFLPINGIWFRVFGLVIVVG